MTTSDLLSADSHFAFGKNWLDYAQKIDEARINQAVADLQRLAGRERFDGLSFLDIGCGSGLHALAAVRMGAVRVVGVDIDADSVAASRGTLAKFAPDGDARFEVVSVFDMSPETHGGFDVVYSWGVLHHTGDMYRALAVAASLVGGGGTFMVALYRKTPFCGMWRRIKRWYSQATPNAQKRAMRVHVWLGRLFRRESKQQFDERISNYGKSRGMDFYNDVHDWMGGYPYESISPEECRAFFGEQGFRLSREFVKTPGRFLPGLLGSGCDEYVFVRT
ncbi:MAG TPA: class I SAM-dependent methyltransferase [Chiayiivirga sp.]|nr:class I SAM-dependent methyltransferase [Chiayiivirga sp.]